MPALAVVGFGLISAASGRFVASPVDKTAVALLHRLQEEDGPQMARDIPNGEPITIFLGGLAPAQGSDLTQCDQAVRDARRISAGEVFQARRADILRAYVRGLWDMILTGGGGLRTVMGFTVAAAFLAQVLLSLWRRRGPDIHVLALGAGVAAHYLGPIALLRGNEPTHYLLVVLPLLLLPAARLPVELWALGSAWLEQRRPGLARVVLRLGAVPLVAVAAWLIVLFYSGAVATMRQFQSQADAEQRASTPSTSRDTASPAAAWPGSWIATCGPCCFPTPP